MLDSVLIFLSGLTVLVSLCIAYFGYWLYRRHEFSSSGWKYLLLGMALLVAHRALVFGSDIGVLPGPDTADFKIAVLAVYFLMLAFLLYGLYRIKKMFDSYDLVEKDVLERIRNFEARKYAPKKELKKRRK